MKDLPFRTLFVGVYLFRFYIVPGPWTVGTTETHTVQEGPLTNPVLFTPRIRIPSLWGYSLIKPRFLGDRCVEVFGPSASRRVPVRPK